MVQSKEQIVTEKLLRYLSEGNFEEEYRLPSERQLALQFETSRITLRSSLKALQASGVVLVKAGSGCYLRSKIKLDILLKNKPGDQSRQITESLEAFYLFEPVAASLATKRITQKELENLEQCVVDLSNSILKGNIKEIVVSHKNFHHIISQATGNEFIVNILERFDLTYVMISNMINQATVEQRSRIFADHVNLLTAMKDRDADRAKTMSEKMIMSTSVLLAQYQHIELPKLIRDIRDNQHNNNQEEF